MDTRLLNEFEALRRERDDLASTLHAQAEQIRALQAELSETNKGVVALYAELDDKAQQLRHLSELKSRFLSYVSHEFRAPLAAIRSVTRMLLDRVDGPLTAEQEKQVLFVESSAQELIEMVNDQLDLAKVEAGRITISPEWFQMVDLFATLRGLFRPLLLREGVRLVFEEPTDTPSLYTDHKKVAQILRNFIANGLKFTERGEVRVTARRAAGDLLTFAVADTGIGIPEDVLPLLFQDFVQVDSPVQKRLRGTGLGLSLSKQFARLLGGSVAAESKVGVGSVFYLTIPIRLSATAAEGRLR